MRIYIHVFLLGLFIAAPSWPQGLDDNPLVLEHVTVIATRNEVHALENPAVVHSLDSEGLRLHRQARTTPESLRTIPGVMVQKTGHGQGSPYIRGFSGFRTLFMVDGVRLNNSIFRDGPNQYWNTVDPYSIGRLELVKGPVSVLYGSDAIGGTANAFTPDPDDLSDGPLATSFLYRYSSAEAAQVIRAEAAGLFANGLGVRAGVSLKEFGDLRSPSGTQRQTGYPERDFDLKLTAVQDHGRWTLAHQQIAMDDAWRTHRTIYAHSFAGTTIGGEKQRSLNQRRNLSYLRYQHFAAGPFSEVTATVSRQQQNEDRFRIRADDRRDWQGTDVNTTGLTLDAGLQGFGRWQFGAEYYRDEVDSFRQDFNADGTLRGISIQGPVADDARYAVGGLYLQNQLNMGAMTWTSGARYTRTRANAAQVQDPQTDTRISIADQWDALVGSLRGLYRPPDKDWAIFGGVSQGFRAPNLSDLSRLDTARSNEIEVPSSDLRPEEFLNYELGFRISRTAWESQFAVFRTDIRNLITRTPTGRTIDDDNEVIKVNSGDGHIHGIEVEASYRLGHGVRLFGAVTWIDGEVLTFPTSSPVGIVEPIDRLMPTTVISGLNWKSNDESLWAELQIEHAAHADRLSTRDRSDTQRIPPGGTPGYTVASLRGGWAVSDRMTISLALENLIDSNYRIHGSGLNEPGRNVILSLSLR